MTRALFLGAGFSAWAAGLPVAANLFDFSITPFGPREDQKLNAVRTAWETWATANRRAHSEHFIAWALAQDPGVCDGVLWYVTRRLSDPYIWQEWHAGKTRRHVLMIDENRKLKRPGVMRAKDFLFALCPLAGILTTNYDLLLEYALGTESFNYGIVGETLTGRGPYPVSQWRNPVTLRGLLPLAKLHGSISWDVGARYTDGRRGLTGKALIVAPTPEKIPPDALTREWQLGAQVLRETTHLISFGFGFNPYDEALLSYLSEHGTNIKYVTLVDICPNRERATTIWPKAEVNVVLPPREDQDVRAWTRDAGLLVSGLTSGST